jgi:hypothetical protein
MEFDERGMLIDETGKVLWDGPWDLERRWDEAEKEAE